MTAVEPKKKARKAAKPVVHEAVKRPVSAVREDEPLGTLEKMVETNVQAPKKDEPPAKPGEPDFDWGQEYPDEDFLVFTAKDGTTVGLAAPSGKRKLKPGDFRVMSHMEGWQQTFYMIEKVASPKALAISDQFDDQDYADMMAAWTEWSGTSAGES